MFLDLISLISYVASIAGVSLKSLTANRTSRADRVEISLYIKFLEGRNVLFAGMANEVHGAVVASLSEIKRETESVRQRCKSEQAQAVLLSVLFKLSVILQNLHGIDASSSKGQYAMYIALQRVRFELAKVLALFCAAFQIDPVNSRMKEFILNFAVKPRN